MPRGDSPDNRSERSAFSLMSFACGALTGAALAWMFAPASGRDTRSRFQRRSRRLANDVSDRSREIWNQQRENLTSAIEQGRDAIDLGREKAAELGSQISEAVEQGKAAYRETKQRGFEEGHDAV